jgi:Tfp pilus assembly protein PilF
MKTFNILTAVCVSALLGVSACGSVQVAQQVQAGRFALQTGRPNDAVDYLMQAAETDPHYRLPFPVRKSVFTYLGRAYYETGRDMEAQRNFEQALSRDPNDHLAHLYLGLTRLRNGEPDRGRKEVETGLKGISETLEYIASDNVYGFFWDPAGTLRSDIKTTLTVKQDNMFLIASAERIGREFDREIDEARRDESRFRSRAGGGGGE